MAKGSPRQSIPFVGPAYQSVSKAINAQETVNFFYDVDRAGGRSQVSLVGRWGLDLFTDLSASAIRGSLVLGSFGYVVAGSAFFILHNDGTWSTPGNLVTNSGIVGIATNGLQVMVVDGVKGYIYDIAAATWGQIASADFLGASDVTVCDSYFVVVNPDSKNAQSSALLDGTTWNALDVAAVENDPDNLIRCISVHGDLWMLKPNSTEIWYDAALAVGFPFVRRDGGVISYGLAAKWGATKVNDTLYWVARNAEGYFGIVQALGYSPAKVSSAAIDAQIASYGDISDCVAWSFADRGHTFIIFTFPSANKSWMFDPSVAAVLGADYAWSELRSFGAGAFKYAHHFFFNNQHLICDITTGKIYKVNWETFTDNGTTIEGIRTAQHLNATGLPLETNRLEIEMERGVGTAEGQGSNPVALLSISKDGGKTFGNEVERGIGKIGEYGYGVTWHRLGTAINWTYRLRITDPVKRVILGAFADMSVGLD